MNRFVSFLFIALTNVPLLLHAQFVQSPEESLRFDESIRSSYNIDSILSYAPATSVGRYRILPDDKGALDFDSSLAFRFQRAMEAEYFATVHNRIKGGFNAAVLVPGKGIWQGAIGVSTETPLDSLHPDMLFCIASNTKAFVAMLMMMLVEEGKVTLEDSIYKYLPKYKNVDSTITIRQLLNMRSGLFDYINDSLLNGYTAGVWIKETFDNPLKRWTPEESLSRFLGLPKHTPGAKYRYTNTSYLLAGLIIEKVTGKKFSNVLREKILMPLNLTNTYFPMDDTLHGDISHGWYNYNGFYFPGWKDLSTVPIDAPISSMWAVGAMYSTTENMARWFRKLFHNEVLQPSSVAEMMKTYDSTSTFGLGVETGTFYDLSLVTKGGSIWGSISGPYYDLNTGIVFVTHRNSYPLPTGFATSNTSALFHAYLQSYKAATTVNTGTITIAANSGTQYRDTTFVVKNIGGAFDSVYITVKSLFGAVPESTYSVIPSSFVVQPNDSQIITLKINTTKLTTAGTRTGKVYIDSRFSYAMNHWEKPFTVTYTLGVDEAKNFPREYSLSQNYPNPFNPTTTIKYQIPMSSLVTLKVFDLLGREVVTLVDEKKDAGSHEITFDATNISSGIYFYQLRSGEFVQTKKLVLQK